MVKKIKKVRLRRSIRVPRFRTTAKQTRRRSAATRRLLSAIGAEPITRKGRGAGRPEGTYKYGMPIHEWKKLQSQRRSVRQFQREKTLRKLQRQGFTEEQIQQFKQQRLLKRLATQAPPVPMSIADEELQLQRDLAHSTISPNTQNLLDDLRRVQNKAKSDDINMQRTIKEKGILAQAGNLLKAPNLFGPNSAKFNILDMRNNILTAPNIFSEDPDDNILKQKRPSILQTKETGNNLWF